MSNSKNKEKVRFLPSFYSWFYEKCNRHCCHEHSQLTCHIFEKEEFLSSRRGSGCGQSRW